MRRYTYEKLDIIHPQFGSSLTRLIMDLNHLRKKELGGTTPKKLFFQLKIIFHILESWGSARIEGNHTTIADYVEAKLERPRKRIEKHEEIANIEMAMDFIDKNIDGTTINDLFIRELHKKVVANLLPTEEGDHTPGEYRKNNIKIEGSTHIPPDYTQVLDYMEELNLFINDETLPDQYDLLKIALAHHRFVWIHPFGNGNGRTVRLLTYAQLVKSGFKVREGRIINPTAVFCSDRNKYNLFLSKADSGEEKELLNWSEYVLQGLIEEIKKVDKLSDYKYLSENILYPAIDFSLDRKLITPKEASILKLAVRNKTFQANDLRESIFPNESPLYISRQIKKLKTKRMISSETKKGRSYSVEFENNYLLRGIIEMLDKKGFLPVKESK